MILQTKFSHLSNFPLAVSNTQFLLYWQKFERLGIAEWYRWHPEIQPDYEIHTKQLAEKYLAMLRGEPIHEYHDDDYEYFRFSELKKDLADVHIGTPTTEISDRSVLEFASILGLRVDFSNGCSIYLNTSSEDFNGVVWGVNPYGADWGCNADDKLTESVLNWVSFWNEPRDETGTLMRIEKH